MIRESYFVEYISSRLHRHPFSVFDERALTGQTQSQILTMMSRTMPSHILRLSLLISLPSSRSRHRRTREAMPSNRLMGNIDETS